MCLARSNNPPVYERPDPRLKYKDGNVFDPLPEPEPTATDIASTNNNNDNESPPPGYGEGTVIGLNTGLNIPSTNLNLGITTNSTLV